MVSLVLDNGAYNAKVANASCVEPRIIPNFVCKAKNVRTRAFIGDQMEECKDLSGLYYQLAFQKGYLLSWEIQKQVWDYIFGNDCLKTVFVETNLLVTESYLNFPSIQDSLNEVFFEEYNFKSLYRCPPAFCSQYKYNEEFSGRYCCLVIDSGYSFTHIIPYHQGTCLTEHMIRIDVGGKLLTNHLKEIISYRQLMVMEEGHVMNQCKEDSCYVSYDFCEDMKKTRAHRNSIVRDYILPDYSTVKRGYVRPQCDSAKCEFQTVRLNSERFAVPEILFTPSDIGLDQMGIAEAIHHTIKNMQPEMQPHMYSNIVLTGGNCLFPGFKERLEKDLRSFAPDEFDVSVYQPENCTTYAWQGGCQVAQDPAYKYVTKREYEEHGHAICNHRFQQS